MVNFAQSMAANAALMQDGGDVLGIGDFALRYSPLDSADEAADWLLSRLAHVFAREQVVERVGKKALRRDRARIAYTELVVDPAPVADDALGIDDKYFRRPLRPALIGNDVAGVSQNGKVDFVLARVMRDFRQRVLLVRVNADERHSLWLVLRCQLGKP